MFINLKFYSEFSIETGILKIEEILERLKTDRQKYLCLTDKNNISSSVKLSILSKYYNIKSIIGTEIYLHDNKESIYGHITILVKNKKGYENICSIINKTWKNFSKYGINYVDLKYIKKKKEGLIFYSGGKYSYSNGIFFENNVKKLYKTCDIILKYIKNNFLIEIQRFNKKSILESEKLISLSYNKKIPLVATNPNFFIKKEEKFIYETKICIKSKIKYKDLKKKDIRFHKYLSNKKANKLFKDIPSAILNTNFIAKKCIYEYNKKNRFPEFYKNVNPYKELKNKLFKIVKKNKLNLKYINVLKHEINIIKKTNFSHFFLIVHNIIKWAKKNKIQVGPGRGSSASSLVAYLLKITEVDPVYNDLLFERFLNKNKNCMPDFDIDFSHKSRKLIIKYIQKKYGKNNVLNIVTFGKFALKNSIKDSGRIFGINYIKINELIKNKEKIKKKKFYKASKGIENRIRNIGIHAGGIIIYNSTNNKLPFFYINKKNKKFVKTSQFDKYDIEYLGFLKLDILGLKTLTVIEDIKKRSNFYKNFSDLNFDNKKVFDLICKGLTNGIFQLESYGIKKLLTKVKPRNFNDLVSVLALYRPGTIFLIDKFCKKKNSINIKYINDKIKKITIDTYGIIIYQEQIIKIITECYNININKAEEIRKYISKNSKNIIEIKKLFLNKIKKKYLKKEKKIFNIIIKYSGYLFNKAHAVSYAMITYYMAYLKINFYKNFVISNINNFILDKEKTNIFIEEALKKKIFFKKPSVNKSKYKFIKKKNNILFGFGGIKNLGKKASDYIINERKKRKFNGFYDFYFRMDKSIVNKRKIESLIFSNTFTNNIKKKINYIEFLKKKTSNNINQLRIFSNFIKVKKKIKKKHKLFFMKKEFYHIGIFLKCPIKIFKKEITLKINYIKKIYKFNFFYIGYIKKIFITKNGSYFVLLQNGKESKSFFILRNILNKAKNMDIVILIGLFFNNRLFIKKVKKI